MTHEPRASEAGSYAPVNDLEMYYEIHGTGRPLAVLPGTTHFIPPALGLLTAPISWPR